MKNLKTILTVFAIATVFSASAYAQDEFAVVNATATVTGALTINVTDVTFGSVNASAAVDLAANSNDGTSTNTGAGATAGSVALSAGTAGAEFQIDWNTDATLTDQDGNNSSVFTPSIYAGATPVIANTTDLTLDTNGELTLDIGGTWTAPAATGTYSTGNTNGKVLTIGITYN